MGKWSENEVFRTEDLEMGMSGVVRKRSKMEAEEFVKWVGVEIGWMREWEVMNCWKDLERGLYMSDMSITTSN